MRILHLGAENSIIVSHLIELLADSCDGETLRQGVVVCGENTREELDECENVTRHFRPGSGVCSVEVGSAVVNAGAKFQSRFKQVVQNCSNNNKLWFIKRFMSRARERLRHKKWLNILNQYDVLHLQSIFWGRESEIALYQWKGKLVVSIWGSDLMRQNDIKVIEKQKKLLERADVITVSGVELREILLAKFGRALKPKIVQSIFSSGETVKNFIEKTSKENAHKNWSDRLNLSGSKKIICVGHNGASANNHILIIRAISELSSDLKNDVHIVLPMTYGTEDRCYSDQVMTELKRGGLEGTILEEFMTELEVAELRLASDVFIYGPESDAFSASVSQALMAQSVVICAAWLPYSARRQYGFDYLEFSRYCELSEMLREVLYQYEVYLARAQKNKDLSISFFEKNRLRRAWLNAYNICDVTNH